MASLQIRQLPDELYEALSYRAERAGRSLAQQAVAELRAISELDGRSRRLETVQKLRKRIQQDRSASLVGLAPEALIREDRER